VQTVQKTALRSDKGKIAIAVSSFFSKIVASTGQPRDRHKTGVNIAASLHFVAALPNTHYFEYCVEQGALRQHLTTQTFPVIDGTIAVPEGPGLGVELDEEIVAKYRVG
jgi:L-alanine-DL-glutamate epimerase-like enolase superfamily enzyme